MSDKILKINENQIDDIVVAAKDASLLAGLTLYLSNKKTDPEFDKIASMAYTLLPSPFSKREYTFAIEIQSEWNKLLNLCANDYDFLYECLEE